MRKRCTRDPLIFSGAKDFSPVCLSHSGLTIYRCVPLRAFRVSEDTLGLTLLICRARRRSHARTHVTHDTSRTTRHGTGTGDDTISRLGCASLSHPQPPIQENSLVRCDTSITNCFPNRRYRTPSDLKTYIHTYAEARLHQITQKEMHVFEHIDACDQTFSRQVATHRGSLQLSKKARTQKHSPSNEDAF